MLSDITLAADISQGGSIYTMEISRHYTSGLGYYWVYYWVYYLQGWGNCLGLMG